MAIKDIPMLDITAHKLVSHIAEELAGSLYEDMASDNSFYKVNADQKDFIRRVAPMMRKSAKAVLGAMLERNDVSEAEKHTIYEALILDNVLPKTGVGAIKK